MWQGQLYSTSYLASQQKIVEGRMVVDHWDLLMDLGIVSRPNFGGFTATREQELMYNRYWLHHAGDPFQSEVEAVIAFGLIYNPISHMSTEEFPRGREWGANIWRNANGTYSFLQVVAGTEDTIHFATAHPWANRGGTRVANVHTHPNPSGGENFTGRDMRNARHMNVTSYIVTPGGYVKKYAYSHAMGGWRQHGSHVASGLPMHPDVRRSLGMGG
jgi:hypothetical protein